MTARTRDAIFISHANPEDNAFTVWLGARLTAAGYEVWADVLRLRGGQDWQRLLEDALRHRACKVLLVGTEHGVRKQGVRNEIQIAHTVSRRIGDEEFVAADYVIHMDPWWNPAAEDQASDRAHRIGQTRPVTIYRLVAKGTIEEQIVALHHHKRALAERLLEGADAPVHLDAGELLELLRRPLD